MIPIKLTVPTRYPPFITWTLIALNCFVFFIELNLAPDELYWLVVNYGLIPARITAPFIYGAPPLREEDLLPFITMMFLHAGWLHLIFNMWTLWLFGPAIEDRLGHGRFLFLYVLCGLGASLAQIAVDPSSDIPAIGASGAIAGILGCALRLFPFSRVIVVVPVLFLPVFFELHAAVYIAFWFLVQVLEGMLAFVQQAEAGVAWWAHVGGFIIGLLVGPLMKQSTRRYRAFQPDEGVLGFDLRGGRHSSSPVYR